MKVAIPTFGERVSPRFDCAGAIRLVTLDRGVVTDQVDVNAAGWSPHERIDRMSQWGVEVVICGGIDRWSADALVGMGIQVYGWVCGSIEGSLEALQRGELAAHSRAAGSSAGSPGLSDPQYGRGERSGRRRRGRG